MDFPEFKLADKGTFFAVLIFDDYVIKVPRERKIEKIRNQLKGMEFVQNKLAKKVPGVLPCKLHNNCIVMPRAPGVRCNELEGRLKKRADELMGKLADQFKAMGYRTEEINGRNTFYDEETDTVYFVDFHDMQKVGE